MSIQTEVIAKMKEAMKAKDTVALTALRSLKSAFMLAKTESGVSEELTESDELKIVQKQVKQRKDSADVFMKQNREDLAEPELAELKVLSQFLPEAMSNEAIEKVVEKVIATVNAQGMKDMGKVMGLVSKELAGKADGSTISAIVKAKLA